MNAKEFLDNLSKLKDDARFIYSANVLSLSKVSCAEVIPSMLADTSFVIKVNALKAIRKHSLDIFERDILALLLNDSEEIQIAAIKTIASFGKSKDLQLIIRFFEESVNLQGLIIDSFRNYSDNEDTYLFMMKQIVSRNEKVQHTAIEWFKSALMHEIIHQWIIDAYDKCNFDIKRAFELSCVDELQHLFYDKKYGFRFKLIYLEKNYKNGN